MANIGVTGDFLFLQGISLVQNLLLKTSQHLYHSPLIG